jgi:hypothetical protein
LGEASKEVSISIKLAPIVRVVPNKLKLTNGETGLLECVVEGNYGDFKISWKDEFEVLGVKVVKNFKLNSLFFIVISNIRTYHFTNSPQLDIITISL